MGRPVMSTEEKDLKTGLIAGKQPSINFEGVSYWFIAKYFDVTKEGVDVTLKQDSYYPIVPTFDEHVQSLVDNDLKSAQIILADKPLDSENKNAGAVARDLPRMTFYLGGKLLTGKDFLKIATGEEKDNSDLKLTQSEAQAILFTRNYIGVKKRDPDLEYDIKLAESKTTQLDLTSQIDMMSSYLTKIPTDDKNRFDNWQTLLPIKKRTLEEEKLKYAQLEEKKENVRTVEQKSSMNRSAHNQNLGYSMKQGGAFGATGEYFKILYGNGEYNPGITALDHKDDMCVVVSRENNNIKLVTRGFKQDGEKTTTLTEDVFSNQARSLSADAKATFILTEQKGSFQIHHSPTESYFRFTPQNWNILLNEAKKELAALPIHASLLSSYPLPSDSRKRWFKLVPFLQDKDFRGLFFKKFELLPLEFKNKITNFICEATPAISLDIDLDNLKKTVDKKDNNSFRILKEIITEIKYNHSNNYEVMTGVAKLVHVFATSKEKDIPELIKAIDNLDLNGKLVNELIDKKLYIEYESCIKDKNYSIKDKNNIAQFILNLREAELLINQKQLFEKDKYDLNYLHSKCEKLAQLLPPDDAINALKKQFQKVSDDYRPKMIPSYSDPRTQKLRSILKAMRTNYDDKYTLSMFRKNDFKNYLDDLEFKHMDPVEVLEGVYASYVNWARKHTFNGQSLMTEDGTPNHVLVTSFLNSESKSKGHHSMRMQLCLLSIFSKEEMNLIKRAGIKSNKLSGLGSSLDVSMYPNLMEDMRSQKAPVASAQQR